MTKYAPLAPMLHARDLNVTIAFYRDVLGFELEGTWPEPAAKWCSLRYRPDSTIMFTNDPDEGELQPVMTGTLYFYPDDVDGLFARIAKQVPRVLFAPRDQIYGMREFRIEDPNGYVLSFGSGLDQLG